MAAVSPAGPPPMMIQSKTFSMMEYFTIYRRVLQESRPRLAAGIPGFGKQFGYFPVLALYFPFGTDKLDGNVIKSFLYFFYFPVPFRQKGVVAARELGFLVFPVFLLRAEHRLPFPALDIGMLQYLLHFRFQLPDTGILLVIF